MNKNKAQRKYSIVNVFFIVWTVVSIILLCIIMLPFLFEKQFVLQLSLSCQSAKHGVECAFCGMTRAFIEISEGDLGEATSYNKGSVWLFVGMLLNTLVYVAYISRKKYSNSVLKL